MCAHESIVPQYDANYRAVWGLPHSEPALYLVGLCGLPPRRECGRRAQGKESAYNCTVIERDVVGAEPV